MTRLRHSILANYGGQGWTVLMGLAFVPSYLRLLGAESFGMVGFMLGLQSISLLLDFGIGVFISRELARRNHDAVRRDSLPTLVRTFECVVWPISLAIGLAIAASSGLIATRWLNPQALGPEETRLAVLLIAAAVALLWPSSFYASVLTGLEQQPRLNVHAALFATLRYAGVVPVLLYTPYGLLGFLSWFCLVAAVQSLTYAFVSWRRLPGTDTPAGFAMVELANARRFTLGIFATMALSLVLGQVDRFTLSAIRPLLELGYYSVALTVAAGMGRMMQPMFHAIYPRMSRLVAEGQHNQLAALYHLCSQVLAVIAAAIGAILCANSELVVLLWTGDPGLATKIAAPLSLLVAGAALNGLMIAPYALQLAHGITRITTLGNALALLLGVPFCLAAVHWAGMLGASLLMLMVNAAYLVLLVPAVHRRVLPGELKRWYLSDILPPVATAVVASSVLRICGPEVRGDIRSLAWLAASSLVVLLLTTLSSPGSRRWIRTRMN